MTASSTTILTPTGLLQSWRRKKKRYETRYATLRAQVTDAQAKFDALKSPDPIDNFIKPLGDLLRDKFFPGRTTEVLGPFGLWCSVSIHFIKNPQLEGDKRFSRGNIRSLTFTFNNDVRVRDYRKDTGRYQKGTTGEVNGGNHPNVKIPEDATLEWFQKYIG